MNPGRHEPHRINVTALSIAAGSFVTALVVIALVMYALWSRVVPHVVAVPRQDVPTQPRLQAVPRADRITLYRAQAERLSSYGWTDRSAGIAHIPIERAMALLAAKQPAQSTKDEVAR